MAAVNMPNQLPSRIFVEDKAPNCLLPQQQAAAMVQQQQPWIHQDERDSFISWLRGEFAAANAIIDAMCQHLQAIASSPGECDLLLNCLRQRRYNWNAVLHMQQYYSVEEVVRSLRQLTMERRQMHGFGHSISFPQKQHDSPCGSLNHRPTPQQHLQIQDFHSEMGKSEAEFAKAKLLENNASTARSCAKTEEQGSSVQEQQTSSSSSQQPDSEQNFDWHQSNSSAGSQGASTEKPPEEEANLVRISKNFQSFENFDGRVVNVVEGLQICENVFTPLESDHLVSTLRELQGRKVELGATGYKIVGGKRLLKAKSNESMQQIAADNAEELQRSSSQEDTAEQLPVTLQVIIDRLLECQILPPSKRPDSFIVNFLGEGGYLPPQTNNQDFEQPFCIITLQSEYTMVFGRFISMESPRDFKSQFKLLLSVGSVLVLHGSSAKIARYAIPALPTKRCCLVLGKTASKRSSFRNMGFQRSASSGGLINRPNNSVNVVGAVQTLSAVVPVSSSIQPGFPANAAAAPQAGPFPPLPGWSPVPRPGRLISGTGVFLPYNASSSSGPGRPHHAANHRSSSNRNNGPLLQKMNSLPASFRAQNGPSSGNGNSAGNSKFAEEQQEQQQDDQASSSSSTDAGAGSTPIHSMVAAASTSRFNSGTHESTSSS